MYLSRDGGRKKKWMKKEDAYVVRFLKKLLKVTSLWFCNSITGVIN